MHLNQIMQKRNIIKQYKNWYVLDDEFAWNLKNYMILFLNI